MWLSAFGASAVVGAAAAVLYTPAAGAEARTWLASRFGGWWLAAKGGASSFRSRLPGTGKPHPAASAGRNLALQPNRLLAAN